MSTRISSDKVRFEFSTAPSASKVARSAKTPFGLAVLGDFGGRANRGVKGGVGSGRAWRVDCDNFEETLGKLGAALRIALPQNRALLAGSEAGGAAAVEVCFKSLDDFHPDQLLYRAEPLAALAEHRKRLLDPATSASAAGELQKLLARQPFVPPAPPRTAEGSGAASRQEGAAAPAESDVTTLARLLGGKPQQAPPRPVSQPASLVQRLIQTAVAPSVVAGASPAQAALLSIIELELDNQLRSILHDPAFQALEAAWRGMDLLIRNFGGEENIKLFMVDLSKEELASDLEALKALESSATWKLLRSQAEDRAWAAWLGLYTFGDNLADLDLLGKLAKMSTQAVTPFISGATPLLVGCDSFGLHSDPDDWREPLPAGMREAWQGLCALPDAAYVGLALPRFLLRQPYGRLSDPVEGFPFEEMPGDPVHVDYLWGNSAILCAHLMLSEFQADGWDMQTIGVQEIGELPLHRFTANGETEVKPCAEAWLGERAAQAISSKGLMPVLSVKGRNAVRLEGLQSLAGTGFSFG